MGWRSHWLSKKLIAEQGISENEALEKGLNEKSAEFVPKGSAVAQRRDQLQLTSVWFGSVNQSVPRLDADKRVGSFIFPG